MKIAEKLLTEYSNGNADDRFIAKTTLFDRDGSYALLCNDKEDEDGGIVVCISPEGKVVSQDEYL